MKFSITHPDFPWFEPLKCSAFEILVEVDGEEQRQAIAFDTVEGWVDRNKLDDAGNAYIMKNGEVATERVRGVVTISRRRS